MQKWRRQTFAKVTPFTGCQLDGVKDKDLRTSTKCEFAYGCIDDIFPTLYWTEETESWFDGRAEGSGVGSAMLSLWMEGDLEVVEGLFEQFRWGKSGFVGC